VGPTPRISGEGRTTLPWCSGPRRVDRGDGRSLAPSTTTPHHPLFGGSIQVISGESQSRSRSKSYPPTRLSLQTPLRDLLPDRVSCGDSHSVPRWIDRLRYLEENPAVASCTGKSLPGLQQEFPNAQRYIGMAVPPRPEQRPSSYSRLQIRPSFPALLAVRTRPENSLRRGARLITGQFPVRS
jgi:hypothetical protein